MHDIAQEEREQLRARAEAQNWEGVEETPPEPTEAQLRAAERAEEVRRLRKVCLSRNSAFGTWRADTREPVAERMTAVRFLVRPTRRSF